MRATRLIRSLCIIGALCCAASHANMAVDRNILYYTPGDADSRDVTVSNQGEEPLFIEVEVVEVHDPGLPGETRVPLQPTEGVPLLVSPNKLVLAPGNKRLLRVVNLAGHTDQERVFRITLRPIPPPAQAEQSGIRLFVAYQLLAIVSPQEPRAELHSRRDGDRLILENRGNANALLHSGSQCPQDANAAEAPEVCVTLRGNRLYPGNVWELEIPFRTPVEFTVTEASRDVRQSF